MRVIATAGHVDHGKSALVRALTGMEPDRPEERRRGMTIDLGFAWTTLAGGEQVAFVDVPGHERLVGTMLAGAGPVPAVLFVVAADQGWQRQSTEHLAVLDALGARHGLLAVTRCDLADPAPALAEARDRLRRSSLGAVEAVGVSSATGSGLPELRAALARLACRLPAPDTAADVRLWVDRAFIVRGRGLVVTGTLSAGTIARGDRLHVADGAPVRVRGLQSLKRERQRVEAVARVAVNVHGSAHVLRRGDALLSPERWQCADLVDARLADASAAGTRPAGSTTPRLPRRLTLHVGTAAVPAGCRPLGGRNVRLSLARALPLRVGDRILLRDPSRHDLLVAAAVLDTRPPALTRRGAAAARARDLDALSSPADGAAQLRARGLARREDLAAMGVFPAEAPVAGEWLVDPEHWAALRGRLETAVQEHAERYPARPGLPLEVARRALGLPDRALVDALANGAGTVPLDVSAGRVYGARNRPLLPAKLRAAVEALRADLAGAPFRAPDAGRLRELGLTPAALAAAAALGAVLRIGDGVVLLPGADGEAARILANLPQPFTVSQARQALATTRRVAVPLLEHLDRRGWTQRLDELRRRCRGLPDLRPGGGFGGDGRESNPPARDPQAPRF